MRTLTKSLTATSLSCRGDGLDDEAGDEGYSAENRDNPLRNIVVYARRVPARAHYTTGMVQTLLYHKLNHIDSSLPSCKFIRLIGNTKISRAATGKVFRLRSRHIPLNAHLHRFKKKSALNAQLAATTRRPPSTTCWSSAGVPGLRIQEVEARTTMREI